MWAQATAIWPSTVGLNTTYPLEWRFNYTNIPTNGTAQIQARLLRLTSSTNMNLTDDVAGHFTTLNTTVNTGQTFDHVGDGIPDSWRAQYFSNQPTNNASGTSTNGLSCAACDADGTGQNNFFKYVAGLDPTNPASVFLLQVASVTNQPTLQNLMFNPVASGRTYILEFSTDLVGGIWSPLTTGTGPVTNNGTQITITDTNAAQPAKFYRVDIHQP